MSAFCSCGLLVTGRRHLACRFADGIDAARAAVVRLVTAATPLGWAAFALAMTCIYLMVLIAVQTWRHQ